MADLAKARADLAKAERELADGERRVSRQLICIENLRRDGHDTAAGTKLLEALQRTLAAWREHRGEILHEIELAQAQGAKWPD